MFFLSQQSTRFLMLFQILQQTKFVHFSVGGLCLIGLLGLQGCKFYDRAKTALFGQTAEEGIKVKKKPKVAFDENAEKLKFDAINQVKKAKARRGWTVEKEVAGYKKLAATIAKKKHLAIPTGFEWSAICAKGGVCKVRMTFWDGRHPLQAIWLVSDGVVPINCWAYSFMARLKKARTCFAKITAAQAKKKAALRKKAAGGNIWEKGNKGRKKAQEKKKMPIISPRTAASR